MMNSVNIVIDISKSAGNAILAVFGDHKDAVLYADCFGDNTIVQQWVIDGVTKCHLEV
ncbi:MAG: hypothetical protein WC763_07050 [Candidatus Paceibacterota bacterium]|jgi:hypothetical protein